MVDALHERFSVTLLGGFAVHRGAEVCRLRPSSQRLVSYLAVEGPCDRLEVALRLWPDVPHERCLANLRTVLWRLRRDAPGLVIERAALLELAGDEVDLRAVRDWSDEVVAGRPPPEAAPEHLGRELLPGWSDAWLIEPREELRLVQLHALEAAATNCLMAGRLGEACSRALAAVRMDPLRESATRLLVEIHLREGNSVDALRRYRRYEDDLRTQVDSRPTPALVALVAHLIAT